MRTQKRQNAWIIWLSLMVIALALTALPACNKAKLKTTEGSGRDRSRTIDPGTEDQDFAEPPPSQQIEVTVEDCDPKKDERCRPPQVDEPQCDPKKDANCPNPGAPLIEGNDSTVVIREGGGQIDPVRDAVVYDQNQVNRTIVDLCRKVIVDPETNLEKSVPCVDNGGTTKPVVIEDLSGHVTRMRAEARAQARIQSGPGRIKIIARAGVTVTFIQPNGVVVTEPCGQSEETPCEEEQLDCPDDTLNPECPGFSKNCPEGNRKLECPNNICPQHNADPLCPNTICREGNRNLKCKNNICPPGNRDPYCPNFHITCPEGNLDLECPNTICKEGNKVPECPNSLCPTGTTNPNCENTVCPEGNKKPLNECPNTLCQEGNHIPDCGNTLCVPGNRLKECPNNICKEGNMDPECFNFAETCPEGNMNLDCPNTICKEGNKNMDCPNHVCVPGNEIPGCPNRVFVREAQFIQEAQPKTTKVDILFVMDTSASIYTERKKILKEIPSLIRQLPDPGNNDYRIAILPAHSERSAHYVRSGDSGRTKESLNWGGKLYRPLNQAKPMVLPENGEQFNTTKVASRLVQEMGRMFGDTESDGGELGLYGLYHLFTNRSYSHEMKQHFLRDDAALLVFFIADENDICYNYKGSERPRYQGNPDRDDDDPVSYNDIDGFDPAEIRAKEAFCIGALAEDPVGEVAKVITATKGEMPAIATGIIYTNPETVPNATNSEMCKPREDDGKTYDAEHRYCDENEVGRGYFDLINLLGSDVTAVDLASAKFDSAMSYIGKYAAQNIKYTKEFGPEEYGLRDNEEIVTEGEDENLVIKMNIKIERQDGSMVTIQKIDNRPNGDGDFIITLTYDAKPGDKITFKYQTRPKE